MQVPFFPPLFPSDPESIVGLALDALGLDEAFLRNLYRSIGGKPTCDRRGRWRLQSVGVYEWIWICNTLYLPVDSLTVGYFRATQRAWAGCAIEQGLYVLPRTKAVEELFREYISSRRRDVAFEKAHTGDPLRSRLRRNRYRESIRRRAVRHENLEKLASVRERLQQWFESGDAVAGLSLGLTHSRIWMETGEANGTLTSLV